jgi:hypothetical protein
VLLNERHVGNGDGFVCRKLALCPSCFRFELYMIDLAAFSLPLLWPTGIEFPEIAPMSGAAKPRPRAALDVLRVTGDEHAWINCPLDPQRTAHRVGLADTRVPGYGQVTRDALFSSGISGPSPMERGAE